MSLSIPWGLTEDLEDIDYTEGICFLDSTFGDMQMKLDLLTQIAQAGLNINNLKTKTMCKHLDAENVGKFKTTLLIPTLSALLIRTWRKLMNSAI